jgi:hypothetical protein
LSPFLNKLLDVGISAAVAGAFLAVPNIDVMQFTGANEVTDNIVSHTKQCGRCRKIVQPIGHRRFPFPSLAGHELASIFIR